MVLLRYASCGPEQVERCATAPPNRYVGMIDSLKICLVVVMAATTHCKAI